MPKHRFGPVSGFFALLPVRPLARSGKPGTGGEQARGRINQEAHKPGGDSARHRGRISHGARARGRKIKPGGERERVRTSQGENRQRGEKAIILRTEQILTRYQRLYSKRSSLTL